MLPPPQIVNAHLNTSQIKIQLPEVRGSNNLSNICLPNLQGVLSPQGIQPSTPLVNSTSQPSVNAISVNVSGQPLLTVELPAPVISPPKSLGNLISSNVPGRSNPPPATDISDLFKPAPVPGYDNRVTTKSESQIKSSVSSSGELIPPTPKIENLINCVTTMPQNFDCTLSVESKTSLAPPPVSVGSNSANINGLLSSIVSEALSDLPDLSTPPGTPQPFYSTKSSSESNNNFLSNMEGITASTSNAYPSIPSPSLFNSSLSMDSLPSLNGLSVNTQLVTAPPPTTVSFELPSSQTQRLSPPTPLASLPLSLGTPLLTTATTSHLELSPPPMQTNSFSSLLNTPTPPSTQNMLSTPEKSTSPTALSSLLHSPTSGISKGFSSLLDSIPRSSSSSSSSSSTSAPVPELHIPEGTLNLPLPELDISIGGTVSLADQTSGLLSSEHADRNTVVQITSVKDDPTASPVRSSTPTSSAANEHRIEEAPSEKLLDITLGISNSDSSFSSKLIIDFCKCMFLDFRVSIFNIYLWRRLFVITRMQHN